MAKLDPKERNLMRQRNLEKFRNNTKVGDVNKEIIPPSQIRASSGGKGDAFRGSKSKFDSGYDYYMKHKKKKRR